MDERFIRFEPKSDYKHDIKLMKFQLEGLRELYRGIGKEYFELREERLGLKIVPGASHRRIIPAACPGRVLMAEHQVVS